MSAPADGALDILFFDIGGVCLTNGWDRHARADAIEHFGLDADAVSQRHYAVVEPFERGELSLDAYLDAVVFDRPRDFTRDAFIDFMYSRSRPHQRSLDLVAELADAGRYRLATINNESSELNRYRIEHFGLDRWFEAFFSSCYVGVRKPEPHVYRIATDVLHADPARCLFIDDRAPNVQGALTAGLRAVHVQKPEELRQHLAAAGVCLDGVSGFGVDKGGTA